MQIAIGSSERQAIDHLERGLAIAVPGPELFPYVIAGVSAAAVNKAKGRPAEQPAMLVVADLKIVSSFVSLDEEALSYAKWLTSNQLIHLLVPVNEEFLSGPEEHCKKECLE